MSLSRFRCSLGVGVFAFVCSAVLFAQKDSAATVELRAIVRADQAIRTSTLPATPEAIQKMVAEDRHRRERVAALLQEGKLSTGEDFDNAALVFQHGETPGDFLTAHELAVLATLNGRRNSLVGVAEDRFLEHIGRLQRFGTQFAIGKDGKMTLSPVSEGHPTDVTDALRADMFLPTPAQWRAHPNGDAYTVAMPMIEARQKRVADEKRIAKEQKRAWAVKLRQLVAEKENKAQAIEEVLALYHADELLTPEDCRNAAQVLSRRSEPDTLLLAHELAVVAAIRGDKQALPLVAETMDSFLISVGGKPRYRVGKVEGSAQNSKVQNISLASETVQSAFVGLSAKH